MEKYGVIVRHLLDEDGKSLCGCPADNDNVKTGEHLELCQKCKDASSNKNGGKCTE